MPQRLETLLEALSETLLADLVAALGGHPQPAAEQFLMEEALLLRVRG